MELSEIKAKIEQRIKELNEADSAFCQERWDMKQPEWKRNLAREMSNAVTQARQELQSILKLFNQ